jgi:hypothetical protein
MQNRTEGKAVPLRWGRLAPEPRQGVSVSLSPAEAETIRAGAAAAGARSFSEYVRTAALAQAAHDLGAARKAA